MRLFILLLATLSINIDLCISATQEISQEIYDNSVKHCRVFHNIAYNGIEADCSNLGLTSIPKSEQVPENLVSLNLSNNYIEEINEAQFRDFENLKSLNLSRNRLLEFPLGIFKTLRDLESLDLSNNLISSIPAAQKYSLKKLRSLNLSQNNISELQESQFVSMPYLKFLYLKDVPNLDEVHSRAISTISPNLEVLDMRNCGLKRVDFLRSLGSQILANSTKIDLYLDNNNFVCDCYFKDSLKLLNSRKKSIVDYENLKCSYPGKMNGKKVSSLTPAMLGCRPGAGQIRMVDFNDDQIRAKCAFNNAEEIHWYIDNSSIDALATSLTQKNVEPIKLKSGEEQVLISTITLDKSNIPEKLLKKKNSKNGTNAKNSFECPECFLECRSHNEFGTSRRFINLTPGSKDFEDPWSTKSENLIDDQMAWRSTLLTKYSHNTCHNTKIILICIILILVIILICIIPLITIGRQKNCKKVIHFTKEPSISDSFNRSIRSVPHNAANNNFLRNPSNDSNETNLPNMIGNAPYVASAFEDSSNGHRISLQRNQSSTLDIGTTNRRYDINN